MNQKINQILENLETLTLLETTQLITKIKEIFNINIEGWTSVIASIWFFGGLIILFLGIIAIYISKIFIETKNRPFSIIKKIYRGLK